MTIEMHALEMKAQTATAIGNGGMHVSYWFHHIFSNAWERRCARSPSRLEGGKIN